MDVNSARGRDGAIRGVGPQGAEPRSHNREQGPARCECMGRPVARLGPARTREYGGGWWPPGGRARRGGSGEGAEGGRAQAERDLLLGGSGQGAVAGDGEVSVK